MQFAQKMQLVCISMEKNTPGDNKQHQQRAKLSIKNALVGVVQKIVTFHSVTTQEISFIGTVINCQLAADNSPTNSTILK